MTDNEKLAWAAGFFDGEGTVAVTKAKAQKKRKTTSGLYWNYALLVTATQRSPEPLKILVEMFGGSMFAFKKYGTTYHKWQAYADNAVRALTGMLPYLTVKAPVARVGLEFQESKERHLAAYWKSGPGRGVGRVGRTGYPEEVLAQREAFYLQARNLNQRFRTDKRQPKWETIPQVVNTEKPALN
jgi:hypothetical protein